MRTAVRLGLAVLFAWALRPANAEAVVTDFNWSPGDFVLGESVNYFAVDNAQAPLVNQIAWCKWEYMYDSGPAPLGGCQTPWIVGPSTGTSQTWTETVPGPYHIRLTVHYLPGFGPPIPDVVITHDIHVPEADGFRIVPGTFGPADYAGGITVQFVVTSGGRDCGGMVTGLAQEILTDKTSMDLNTVTMTAHPADDSAWSPINAAEGVGKFYLQGNTIFDVKFQGWPQMYWNVFPTGNIYKRTQSLRLRWTDPCGAVRISNLGSVVIYNEKLANGQWDIHQ